MYMGWCTYIICKYYAILYKGLEHPWILVSWGSLNQSPTDAEEHLYLLGTAVCQVPVVHRTRHASGCVFVCVCGLCVSLYSECLWGAVWVGGGQQSEEGSSGHLLALVRVGRGLNPATQALLHCYSWAWHYHHILGVLIYMCLTSRNTRGKIQPS